MIFCYTVYIEVRKAVSIIYTYIKELLLGEGIELFAPVPLSDCRITKKYLLDRAGIEGGTAIMIAVPYLSEELAEKHNISAYCAVRDYHGYFAGLWKRILTLLAERFPENRFAGFADHSPIDERDAAAHAGIGIYGKNGMLITEKYSSYVFLGELITDAEIPCESHEIRECEGCMRCRRECPMSEIGQCLSALTQKKGEFTESEAEAVRKYGSVWGCDICQEVCPHTMRAMKDGTIYTNIEYFKEGVISVLDLHTLDSMSDEEFLTRAFSWRGRNTIRRNLLLFEK